MSQLGDMLRKAREEQGKTLAAVKNDTRIQESFLLAIEDGNYGALPSYLHAYGFVKQYAEYLGFNYGDVKIIFDRECPKQPDFVVEDKDGENDRRELIVTNPIIKEKQTSNIAKDHLKPEIPSFEAPRKNVPNPVNLNGGKSFSFMPVIVGAIVIIIIVGAILFFSSKGSDVVVPAVPIDNNTSQRMGDDDASPTDSPVIDTMDAAIEDNSSSVYNPVSDDNASAIISDNSSVKDNITIAGPSKQTDNASINTPAKPSDNVSSTIQTTVAPAPVKQEIFTVSFSEECWVSYSADNKTAQEYLSPAGTNLSLKFDKFFTLDIGNAAAVTIKYNGQTFSGFGRPGIVRKLQFKMENGLLIRVGE